VPYQNVVAGWHDFYALSGVAAATLVGLLFVGLSLHLPLIVARSDVRTLARITLANFGLTLFVSLFVLIPQSSSALGWELIIVGVVVLLTVVPSLVEAVRSPKWMLTTNKFVLRFGLSALAPCGVILAGVLTRAKGGSTGLDWLWPVTVALLAISLRNSWDLLVEVGMARSREAGAPLEQSKDAD